MQTLLAMFRFLAIVAGTFVVGSGIADIAGLVPHSEDMPPLASRAASNIWPIFFGLVLIAPQRYFITRLRFVALLLAHLVLVGLVSYRAGEGLMAPHPTGFGWLDLALIAIAAIPVLNTIALWLLWRRGTPPNNSFKGMPLRGTP